MPKPWRPLSTISMTNGSPDTSARKIQSPWQPSCHIPSLVWLRLASYLCIIFKFHLNLKWGLVEPSESFFENDPNKNFSKRVQENAHVALWQYWTEIKIKPIFLGAYGYLILAIWINPIIICFGYILLYIWNMVQKLCHL